MDDGMTYTEKAAHYEELARREHAERRMAEIEKMPKDPAFAYLEGVVSAAICGRGPV